MRLEGSRIGKIWRVGEVFVFETTGDTKFLIVRQGGFYPSNYAPRGVADGFSMYLRKHVSGRIISKVSQYGLDRVVRVDFRDASLVFELFGKGNIVFIENGLVSTSFKRSTRFKKGEVYQPPESINPLTLSDSEFVDLVKDKTKKEVARIIGIGNLVEEIWDEPLKMFSNLKELVEKELSVGDVEAQFKKLDSESLVEKREKIANAERTRLGKSISELKKTIGSYESKSVRYKEAGLRVMSNLTHYDSLIKTALQKGKKRIKVTLSDN
ncbi:MAG: hypothetical protein GOV01_01585 [Candidatus Altiarchaeota archaeon]|nr:hypothetical protein [Candidatus Altiarchaeota archaeon]